MIGLKKMCEFKILLLGLAILVVILGVLVHRRYIDQNQTIVVFKHVIVHWGLEIISDILCNRTSSA